MIMSIHMTIAPERPTQTLIAPRSTPKSEAPKALFSRREVRRLVAAMIG